MNRSFYKKMNDQILDYADEDVISRCAHWSEVVAGKIFEVELGRRETIKRNFIFAVASAVIIGEFASRAFNDEFSDETGIDLDPLEIDFDDVKSFIQKDIPEHRFKFLWGGNSVGLQDIWSAVCEHKAAIYNSLVAVCKQQKIEEDPNDTIFHSLIKIFNGRHASMTEANHYSAYGYISNGFK